MLTLINANRMIPPIGPIGLDYIAPAARSAGIDTRIVDLGLAENPDAELKRAFDGPEPRLVGITFRNVDDSFWPSATWFVPSLTALIAQVRKLTEAPIVVGGVGASIFARALVERTGTDFAVRGDGERAVVDLYRAVVARDSLASVPGLLFREQGAVRVNPPAWGGSLIVPTSRDAIDNAEYFRRGGQAGVETKRGCPRSCIYCADPVAKGRHVRLRAPRDVADEFATLARQGISVIHLCDGEFNVDYAHAVEVCAELIRRGLSERIQWYAYAATTPFDAALAKAMRHAGCVGINFGADSASDAVLARYGVAHRRHHLAETVRLCREHGIRCMVDLLIGGPGETCETVAETIETLRAMGPDCVGAGVGMRLYPETHAAALALPELPELSELSGCSAGGSALGQPLKSIESNGEPTRGGHGWPGERDGQRGDSTDKGGDCGRSDRAHLETDERDPPGIRRRYRGRIDLLQPTFYIAPALGPHPSRVVRELIAGDDRFFPPADDDTVTSADHSGVSADHESVTGHKDAEAHGAMTNGGASDRRTPPNDHNYSANTELENAIRQGARGAYWDILRQGRHKT